MVFLNARKELVPKAVGPKKAFRYFCRTLSGLVLASPIPVLAVVDIEHVMVAHDR